MGISSYHVCYHCKDRTVGCHAKCKMYQEEQAQRQRDREQQKKQSDGYVSREAKQWNHRSVRGKCHKK